MLRLRKAWTRVASEIWGEKTTRNLAHVAVAVSVAFVIGPAAGAVAASATPKPRGAREAHEVRTLTAVGGGGPIAAGSRTLRTHRPHAVAVPVTSTKLVQTIDTSKWSPASPDPSGIVYLPGPDRLEVSDSEVEETTGAGYHGVNLWQITRSGTVTGTGTTLAYSREPTGLGHDPGTNTLFISDDTKKRVWVVKPGSDARFGTSDDVVTSIDAGAYGSTDEEDPAFDPASGHLFFLDGAASEVYDINPVNGVFGDGNDVMQHFDVGKFGPTDWEGLALDQARDALLVGARKDKQIYEVTKSGSLVRIIDASGTSGMRFISGLTMAPASNGSGQMNYWIVDRAVDNGANSRENDGKIFEISTSSSTNGPPTVTNPGTKANTVGDSVGYQIVASDPDGDAIASYNATGLPTGLSVNTDTGFISGTTTNPGTFNVTISATDNKGATGSAAFTWTVTVVSSAPVITGSSPTSGPVGTSVTISGSGFIGTTHVRFNGTNVGSGNFTVDSDAQITATVPSGATTGPISVTTPGGTGTSLADFTVAPVTTLTFGPDADTFVKSDSPSAHPGSKTFLSVDNSPIKHGLLRFTVSGVGSGTLQGVTLRLYCLDASDTGGDFFRVASNSWGENTVTWNTQPAADPTSFASLAPST